MGTTNGLLAVYIAQVALKGMESGLSNMPAIFASLARSNIARWPPHLQQPMALGLRVTHSLWLRLLVPTSFTWTTSKYTPRALLIPRRDCATA